MSDPKPHSPKPKAAEPSDSVPHSAESTGGPGPPPDRTTRSSPAVVGRYELRVLLGEGAFGKVYRGFDPKLERDVAIKIPHPAALTAKFRKRFALEAKAVAKIDHPNVCRVYEVETEGDSPYLVLQFVAGGTLAGVLDKREEPFPPRDAADLLRRIALGVAAAHAVGVLHRDLKPANVLWDEAKHEVLVADFGLVRLAGETGGTSAGQSLGTPSYMPLEQATCKLDDIGPWSDVYSLGVILYELLTNEKPFHGPIHAMIGQKMFDNYRKPSEHVPGLDARLEAICTKAMAKEPKDRYQTAAALADALEEWLKPSEPGAPATDLSSPKPVASLPVSVRPPAPPSPPPVAYAPGSPGLPLDPEPPRPVRPSRVTPVARPVCRPPPKRSPLLWMGGIAAAVLLLVAGLGLRSAYFRDSPAYPTVKESAANGRNAPSAPSLGSVEPKPPDPKPKTTVLAPGETRLVEIAPSVSMTFCWVPAGECQLGSPKAEGGDAEEDETKRGKFTTKGYWMGKYEVPQAEWAAAMRSTALAAPNAFRVGGSRASSLGGITDTKRFPVECISWNDCQEFLKQANTHGGIVKAFGKAGQFALPHEDEWEYACRGGLGNQRPYYFGIALNGTEANCIGDSPFGTATSGQYLDRTSAVDDTNGGKYPAHPWGLCHMHGNVWEWCSNYYEQTNASRVIRGGSWINDARSCRSASRWRGAPGGGTVDAGFRLVLSMD